MKRTNQYLKLFLTRIDTSFRYRYSKFLKFEISLFHQRALKKIVSIRVLFIILIINIFSACDPPKGKTKSEVIEERIAHRMSNWLHTYNKKCREEALDAAAIIVDSTLIVNARRHKDTLNRPPRPMKPDNPNFVAPEDSIPIAPLVDLDSLLRLDSLGILEDSIRN